MKIAMVPMPQLEILWNEQPGRRRFAVRAAFNMRDFVKHAQCR
jgi:hypothetical protein